MNNNSENKQDKPEDILPDQQAADNQDVDKKDAGETYRRDLNTDNIIDEDVNMDDGSDAQTGPGDDFDFILGDNFKIADDPQAGQPLDADHNLNGGTTGRKNKKRSRRRRKQIRAVLGALAIVISAIALAAVTILFVAEYLGIGFKDGGEVTIEVKQGYGTAQIAQELKEAGAINSQIMFRIFCKLGGYDGTFNYGVYTFTNELGYKDIAELLQEEGEQPNVVRVTIPEGSDVDDIIKLLEDNGVCTKSDFRAAMNEGNYKDISFVEDIPEEQVYYRFEGYLYPDTYDFYNYSSRECAELAIRKMLQETDKIWTEEYKKQAETMGYSIHEVMTMASIVELEASSIPEEMPKIAAVFYNRLKWEDEPKMLGSSPTANYPHGDGRYDTNKNEGLPPGPLCSPSKKAIEAALYPQANFTATYFVTDSDMKVYYNETYEAHNRTISKLKEQGKWAG